MSVYTGTLPTLLAGELADADKFLELLNLAHAEADPWTTYTVVWTGGSPVVGNGTLVGKYKQVGKDVTVKIKLTAGTTTTFGSTTWSFSLPVAAAASAQEAGALYMLDSGTANRSGSCVLNATTTVFAISSADGDVGPTVPQVWATGDALVITIKYEAA